MGFVAQQGIGVTHHPVAKAGNGQAVAQRTAQRHRIGHRILQLCQGHHHATNGNGLQTIRSRDAEGAVHAQGLLAGVGAVDQVILGHHPFAALGGRRQVDNHNAIIAAGDGHGQIGGTGIAITIGQGVAVDLSQRLALAQRLHSRIAVVQGEAIFPVTAQHQGAQRIFHGLRGHLSAIGALDVVGQDVATDR